MYHPTTVVLDGGVMVCVQGRLAFSPLITSTVGIPLTVTTPLHTVNTQEAQD